MTPVVIDASAGAEIVIDSLRGRQLLGLLPQDAVQWVPEHFYAEVLTLIRRWTEVTHKLSQAKGRTAARELATWRLHRASIRHLLDPAWSYRHNMTAADALYVVLAEQLSADFLTDDYRLTRAPTFPTDINVLQLPVRP